MTAAAIAARMPDAVRELDLPGALPAGVSFERGKVRDIWRRGERVLIATTDRLSAFDVVLTTIPCKGEVLNRISLFWFNQTRDIVKNHLVEALSARTVLVRRCTPVPVEVVVRGYLTGSAWRDYAAGRSVSGIALPEGMRPAERFPTPLLTPSTKAERGQHDEPVSGAEVVSRRLVGKELWERIELTALALFRRGQELVSRQGLILVDTKYEFGLDPSGELLLIDEIHTPDSSRYWYASSYDELFGSGGRQRELDKEYLRQWLIDTHGFMGQGTPPAIPDDIRVETAARYITAFELITGEPFLPRAAGAVEETALVRRTLPAL
jgi:phosphoribosylaminoimidazole-succinocarboxamide synthase